MLDVGSRRHLARVVIVYREENFDRAVADFRAALSIDFGEILEPPGLGLRIAISLAAGIELIAPNSREGYADGVRTILQQRGEGVLGIVFRVPDLDAAVDRAAAAGWPKVGARIDCFDANPAWRRDYAQLIEDNLAPIAGIDVTLIEGTPAVPEPAASQ